MAYIVPIHRPSSVRHAIKLNFLEPNEESLVVAKANRLEIYSQTSDGVLVLQHSRAIYGKITMLEKLRPASSTTDHLFVGTDRYMYFTLFWNPTARQLETRKSYEDAAERMARDSQTGDRCHVDPSGRFLTLEIYEGIITVIPLISKGKKKTEGYDDLGKLVLSRIEELMVRSSCFLQRPSDIPKIALLYQDNQEKVRLIIRSIKYMPGAGMDDPSVDMEVPEESLSVPREELDSSTSHVIPVSEPAYGALLLADTCITYFDDSMNDFLVRPLDEATIWVAWAQIDSQRFVLADEYGRLYLLMLVLDSSGAVSNWKLDKLGETSRASVLIYLDAGIIFVGSHQGDSQVIKILEGSIEILQTFSNIAPILDFTVMDMGNRSGEGQVNEYSSGQARIVTGSGAFKDGSLRSVRSGVRLEELGVLGEMEHVTNLFGLKSKAGIEIMDMLVVTFIDETRIFTFDPSGEIEEVDEFSGWDLSKTTLFTDNLSHGRLLHITSASVQITDLESGMMAAEWNAPNGKSITAAAANEERAILAVGGTQLVVLSLGDTIEVLKTSDFKNTQISCVTIGSVAENAAVVGFWQSSSVEILNLDNLSVLESAGSLDGSVVPRSVLLTRLFQNEPPTLFIGFADGTIATFAVNPQTFALSGRKDTRLGTQQASFRAIPRGDGTFSVFATCEHSSLIYGSEGRIVFSAITAEKATTVCPFNSEFYAGEKGRISVAIATARDLKIAVIDTERTTHVQTLAVDETVRRIAYSPTLKAFGLGCIKRSIEEGAEIISSHFRLVDEVLFKELDTYAFREDEIAESVIRCRLPDRPDFLTKHNTAERFVVGTTSLDDDGSNQVSGRIIVFEVTNERKLKVVAEISVLGACRCLGVIDGQIVAALIKTVVMYALTYVTESTPALNKLCSFRTATAPCDMHIRDNVIAVADLMKSVSIVEYNYDSELQQHTLKEVCRHQQVAWGTAVSEVHRDTYLESDCEGNLIVLRREKDAPTIEDERRLHLTSDFYLGEMVNRIRQVDVVPTEEAVVIPRAFIATTEGSIHLFGIIAPAYQNLLMQFQSALAELVESPGNMPFEKYRAYKSPVRQEEQPQRFVDGELLERWLDCTADVKEEVIKRVAEVAEGEKGIDMLTGIVERLRMLH